MFNREEVQMDGREWRVIELISSKKEHQKEFETETEECIYNNPILVRLVPDERNRREERKLHGISLIFKFIELSRLLFKKQKAEESFELLKKIN